MYSPSKSTNQVNSNFEFRSALKDVQSLLSEKNNILEVTNIAGTIQDRKEQDPLFKNPINTRILKQLFPNYDQKRYVRQIFERLGQVEKKQLPKFIILPNSVWKSRWDFYIILLVLYNVIVTPMDIGLGFSEYLPEWWKNVEDMIDFSFMGDMIITLRTALIDDMGNLNTNSKDIYAYYLKRGFIIDFIASMPVGLIQLIVGSSVNKRMINLLKTPRLLRVGRIMKYIEQGYYANYFRILKLYIILFIVAHWVGCFFYFLLNDPTQLQLSILDRYINAILNGMLLLFKHTLADSFQMYVYQMIVILVAAGLNAWIFGNMTVFIQNMDQVDNTFRDKMDMINEYMRYVKLPQPIQDEIRNYYEYIWMRHRSMILTDDVFSDLNPALKASMNVFQYEELIKKIPIFHQFSAKFIQEVLVRLKPRLFLPDVCICSEGTKGDEMYFIVSGVIDIYMCGNWIGRLRSGDLFGEIALFLKSSRRTASCISQTYCDLLSLQRDDFDELIFNYKEDVEKLFKIAIIRFEYTKDILSSEAIKKLCIDQTGEKNVDIWKDIKPSRKRNCVAYNLIKKQQYQEAEQDQKANIILQHKSRFDGTGILTKEIELGNQKNITQNKIIENVDDQIIDANTRLFAELKRVLTVMRRRYNNLLILSVGQVEQQLKRKIEKLENSVATLEQNFNEIVQLI